MELGSARGVDFDHRKARRPCRYKDWSKGPVVTFSHGWPLNADAWDGQMLFLAQKGFRVVALDRRGHGRSSQASEHNDMNGYADNPEGVPIDVFDKIRAGVAGDGSQYYKDLAIPFYGAKRPRAKVSHGILDQFWLWSMQTLVMHGEDDQIVPVKDSARKSARLIKGAREIYYPGAPHGLTATRQDQVNADLLAFIKE